MRLLVLASSRLLPFQVDVLDSLSASSNVRMVGAIIDQPATGGQPGPLARLRRHLGKGRGGYVLVMAVQSLIGRLSGHRPIPATRYFAQRTTDLPVLAVRQSAHLYSPATLEFIRQQRPDCIYRSGFGIIREPILSAAPRGVISFHHGDLRKFRGLPPAFWELYPGRQVMGVTVQQLTEQLDAGRIVCEKSVPIAPGDSWASLQQRAYAASVPMIAEACRLLDDPNFQPAALPSDQLGQIYTLPNFRQWLTLQLRVLWRKLRATRSPAGRG